jgi:hypothetical protein
MVDIQKPPVQLEDVLEKEQMQIEKVRIIRDKEFDPGDKRRPKAKPALPIAGKAPVEKPDWQKDATHWLRVIKNAHKMNLVGLAFSGGGIRSASFNLGVLQALADLKLLCRIDYLSTVSGGGYIGSWLAAWTKRVKSFAKVQENISTHRVNLKDDKEQQPVRFLRVFSNYLTPNMGIFSGDTWAMISIYLRNLLLNLTIILALVATFLLLPRTVKMLSREALNLTWIGYGLISAIVVLLLLALWTIQKNMGYLDSLKGKAAPHFTEQKWIIYSACAPIFAAAVMVALWLACPRPGWYITAESWLSPYQLFPYQNAVLIGIIAYGALWGLASLGNVIFGKRIEATATPPLPPQPWERSIKIGATLGAGALAGWLFALLASCQALWQYDVSKQQTLCLPLTVGVPLVAGVFLLTVVLHIGLMGTVFRDWRREWWGRLGGWLLIFSLTWLTLFWVALCFPGFIHSHTELWSGWKVWAMKSLTPAWLLSTIGTVLAGNSKDTGKPGTTSWLDTAIKFGPYIFMAGLLCWVSYGMNCLLATYSSSWPKVLFAAAVVIVLVIMAWRVDINQFSMHMFYRNRLVSCFLGASHDERSPNRFTGFDPADDMPLKNLRWNARNQCGKRDPYDGPYPILNASLNLVKGKDLAWQERKAESFVMTPHYCGYDVWLEEQDSPMLVSERGSSQQLERYGYRPTVRYAFPIPQYHGPNLGLAMAISGAAASPNMGSYSSTPVAFLMTVFNVRLGQWLGNPRNRVTSRRATPRMGLWCLINELFGGTNDDSAYVYLSDGGHFDNMGLYELVKRRCGLIILCDAEEDAGYTFSGLGNAIRKCRVDLGIDIDLDTSVIVPDKNSGLSKQHYAVGAIHYEYADINAPVGTIIYFKSSLTGNESADVKNYKKAHDEFPHESTVDQWFSESQFESYRQLGYETVLTAIRNTPPVPLKAKEKALREHFKDFGVKINIRTRHGR